VSVPLTPLSHNPIALIGIGCRFPGQVSNPHAFWELLRNGIDAVGEIPPARWNPDLYYHPDPAQPGKMYTRSGAFLTNIDQFDAAFFGISASEAASMDPQQRMLLETSWEALEDAGLSAHQLAGSQTGVFVGICSNEYSGVGKQDVNPYSNAGVEQSIASNRISYVFDFHGPSFSVNTACSSSLVALHLACESLGKGECTLALVGGSNLILSPLVTIGFCKASMLSPRGRCHTFDAGADGYVRGEGVGMVVLKPLAQALSDKDCIYGLIRGTGINQDGRTPGLHYPGRAAQEALLHQVYSEAGIAPHQVLYVEAHGTGTIVGDAVECQALGNVLGEGRAEGQPLRVGSVKTNIGHLEGASGMAGLIKAALILKHHQIPKNLHFEQPNSEIPFTQLRLQVQQNHEVLAAQTDPLIIGVNSFGFGGANAHVILQEHLPLQEKERDAIPANPETYLIPLSTRSPAALQALAECYLEVLRSPEAPALRDLCYTASMRRDHHAHRLALVARSQEDLVEKLEAFLEERHVAGMAFQAERVDTIPKIAYIFSGNGPQWWAMGRQLFAEHALFRSIIERCDTLLRPYTGWSLSKEMLADEAYSRMHLTEVAQPALFALQIGLLALWKLWGIEPQAVLGHSVGEIAAAYAAAILSLEDAIYVVFQRSRLQEQTSGAGMMMAVGLSEQEAQDILVPYQEHVSVAAVNSPSSLTLAGTREALEEIQRLLEQRNIYCRLLKLNYAFHSPAMDRIHDEFLSSLVGLRPGDATLPFISTVTGQALSGSECDANYWWRNVRSPVQFSAGIQHLLAQGYSVFLEVGPHPVLSSYMMECMAEKNGQVLPSLRRNTDELPQLLSSLGMLYTLGLPVNWQHFAAGGKQVSLPAYPWQKKSYWTTPKNTGQHIQRKLVHPMLGYRLEIATPTWENSVGHHQIQYLNEHIVQDTILLPGAVHLELAIAAAADLIGEGSYVVEQFTIQQPCFLDNPQLKLQTSLSLDDHSFQVHSYLAGRESAWMLHATGKVEKLSQIPLPARIDLSCVRERLPQEISGPDFYHICQQRGFQYGPAFALIERLYGDSDETLLVIRVPEAIQEACAAYHFHPVLLDCGLQSLIGLVALRGGSDTNYLPVKVDHFSLYRSVRPGALLYGHLRMVTEGANTITCQLLFYNEQGEVLAKMSGLRYKASGSVPQAQLNLHKYLYEERLLPSPLQACQRAFAPLPDFSTLVARVQSEIVHLSQDEHGTHQARLQTIRRLNSLSSAYVLQALQQLGWHWLPDARFSVATLRAYLGIDERYHGLLTHWCALLAEDGVVQQVDAEWLVVSQPLIEDSEALLRELLGQAPAYHGELMLLARCGRRLTAILRGEVALQTVVCPRDDSNLLEHFYEQGQETQIPNHLLQTLLLYIVAQLPPTAPLSILDRSAGTHGIALSLLPLLPANRTVYLMVVSSEMELQRVQKKYRDYPFVHYQVWDFEREAMSENVPEQAFDLVLAPHTLSSLHAFQGTLHQFLSLLTPGGLLVGMEPLQGIERWLQLLLDLLRSESGLNSGASLLSEQGWQERFEESGLLNVASFVPRSATGQASYRLLLAQKPFTLSEPAPLSSVNLTSESWLIFADETGLAAQVHPLLASQGKNCILVQKAESYQCTGRQRFALRPGNTEDLQRLFTEIAQQDLAIGQVVYLWGLDKVAGETTTATLDVGVNEGCLGLLALLQDIAAREWQTWPRLWVITSGVQALSNTEQRSLEQAPLVGLSRVIMNEHPELQCTLLDISIQQEQQGALVYQENEVSSLVTEFLMQPSAAEVVLRGVDRMVTRIERVQTEQYLSARAVAALPDLAYRLDVSTPGALRNLEVKTAPRPQMPPGYVEIAVKATGLSFKDVALTMGLLPAEAAVRYEGSSDYALGLECAGTISTVGEGVENIQIGDEVIALGYRCFSSFAFSDQRLIVRKPANISFEEAATLPGVFLTAHYALHHLAHIQPGERVLVHSAAGGVGLAAIQIVLQAGAEVIATVGSPEKREYLHSLGVKHVLDSRSLAFADEIMQLTHGEGVHIVLNSLSGEAVAKSMSVLRRFGRFLEIGKRDFFENRKLESQHFKRCLSYFAIDIDQMIMWERDLVGQLLREVLARIEQGIYRPLPYRVFPLTQVVEAFRYMQQSRHIGKIVIRMDDLSARVVHRPDLQPLHLREDASYLITGGLSGFGLATASFLAQQGAKHLVLVSRSGESRPETALALEKLRSAGVEVLATAVDVTQKEEIVSLFERLQTAFPPLRGIIHAATLYDDHPLRQMDVVSFQKVVAPKMRGAWHLHQISKDMPLDFFVLFSSVSALFGQVGQGNYVAGNQFLQTLAHYRRSLGLTATTISWGAIDQVGFVARNLRVRNQLQRIGLKPIALSVAFCGLEKALQEGYTHIAIGDIDWVRLNKVLLNTSASSKWLHLVSQESEERGAQGEETSFQAKILELEPDDRAAFVCARLNQIVTSVMGLSLSEENMQRSLVQLGLDSLTAIELRNEITRQMRVTIPVMRFLQIPTIAELITLLIELTIAQSEMTEKAQQKEVVSV
jgi:acyl transferase domain-containing protein/acyl carrier protein